MTEGQKRKYVTANDLTRIRSDQLWYQPQMNLLGIQNIETGSIQQLDVGEPAVTIGGVYRSTMLVHDFGVLGWVLIGDM